MTMMQDCKSHHIKFYPYLLIHFSPGTPAGVTVMTKKKPNLAKVGEVF